MATLKDEAQAYELKQTLNIAELDKVPVGIEVLNGEGKDKEGVVFKYKYAQIDGKEYRIPGIVLGGIKALISNMPNLQYIKVIRQGTGRATTYQVVPKE